MQEKLITLSNLGTFKSRLLAHVEAQNYITASVDNLVNYYLKSETYTKAEVNALIGEIKQFTYETAAALPSASADTMYKIYLVPATASGETQNAKAEFITIRSGNEGSYTYSWEKIGDTKIDLSGYVTITALNNALAGYTTTENLTTLLAGKQDVIDATHKLSADLVEDGTTNKVYTAMEKTKLAGIAAGAQVNVIEAIEVNTGTTDSSNNAAIASKTAKLIVASENDIAALFATE